MFLAVLSLRKINQLKTMKQAFALVFLCISMASTAYTQVRFGLKIGAGTASITDQQLDILEAGGLKRFGIALKEAAYSAHGGLIIQVRMGKQFLIQPELLLQSNSVDYSVRDFSSPGSEPRILKEKYQYLNLPFLLGARIGPLRLNAGPQGHVFLSSRSDLGALEGYKEDFKTMTFSWLAGAGVDVWKTLMLDIRYEGSLTRFGDHITFFGKEYPFEQRQARLIFSAGILFGKKK